MQLDKDYQIRRSSRTKRARIIVSPDKIEVVVPLHLSEEAIQQFILDKQSWVASAQKKVQQHIESTISNAPPSYQQGALIPYQGKKYALAIKISTSTHIQIIFKKTFIALIPKTLDKILSASEKSTQIRAALISWMQQTIAKKSHTLIEYYSPLYQLTPHSIQIKSLKSRWGSCGIHNDISLNWLLILAPAEILEYVVIHELCHIAHHNHSPKFWQLVEQFIPDFKLCRQWLKQNGHTLSL